MRLPKTALAGTAALALTLSLGACSLSVNGSDSAGTTSPAASQAPQADAGSGAAAGTDGPTAKGATATRDSEGKEDADGKKDSDGDDEKAPVTDPAWKEIVDTGERTEVSGAYSVADAGATLNLVGDLETLTIQGAGAKVAAENVGTLIVQGSNVVVYARDIDHVQIQGAGVTVHWLGDDPDIQDQGADNTTGRLTQ
ncbi:hypothetical protein OHJ16_08340 [Actinomyces israelii]|uniref:DUF3060 domain-containing protein n=1 Tax=Actinomyces israelii TaxID=1659 RepID=A0ABT4I8H6_9ACTO|nr:hypothetical protein [Actinomyces israelii]MCZ0858052.1 hypothetical protein [Actinomyces israelii]WKR20473.1 hypothetical protein AIF0345_0353 [Actinomyces israelii]